MRAGDLEPNDVYRPWLEERVGKQGIDWEWYIHSVVENTILIEFLRSDDAILFELTWAR
jgi:hypothetical protein